MAKNPHKHKSLDEYDTFLLVSINIGIDSCIYLANVSQKSKQVVSLRVQQLQEGGLVKVEESSEKYFKSRYVLTPKGRRVVSNTCLDLNKNYLDALKV